MHRAPLASVRWLAPSWAQLPRARWLAPVLALSSALVAPPIAAADPIPVGLWFGPRIFNADSGLGYIDDAPYHPSLHNGIELGARVGHQFFSFEWLVPELELALSPTTTTEVGGAAAAKVLWMEPRVQLRFEILPRRAIQPFVVVGAGTAVAFSSARKTFNSGISGDGYAGGGVRFDTRKGYAFRFDGRVSLLQGVEHLIAPEIEIGFGIDFVLGAKSVRAIAGDDQLSQIADKDGDGIPDAQDKCPDRAEDKDGFEDSDGCPDIDNDFDRVLDVADKCIDVPETYNGFEDDDGCPDTVPPVVEALNGTIEGLFYAETETVVRDSALASLRKIAKVLIANPSVKVVLIGHTDDREAKAFSTTPAEGQPTVDLETISTDLARARAEAVRQALVAAGVPQGRLIVDGVGAEEPVGDNTTNKGRLANRRVAIKLFVAPH